jgi:hypothetical protein
MQAIRNVFKNDLVLVGTNLTVVAGVATYLGITPSFMFPSIMKSSSINSNIWMLQALGWRRNWTAWKRNRRRAWTRLKEHYVAISA